MIGITTLRNAITRHTKDRLKINAKTAGNLACNSAVRSSSKAVAPPTSTIKCWRLRIAGARSLRMCDTSADALGVSIGIAGTTVRSMPPLSMSVSTTVTCGLGSNSRTSFCPAARPVRVRGRPSASAIIIWIGPTAPGLNDRASTLSPLPEGVLASDKTPTLSPSRRLSNGKVATISSTMATVAASIGRRVTAVTHTRVLWPRKLTFSCRKSAGNLPHSSLWQSTASTAGNRVSVTVNWQNTTIKFPTAISLKNGPLTIANDKKDTDTISPDNATALPEVASAVPTASAILFSSVPCCNFPRANSSRKRLTTKSA